MSASAPRVESFIVRFIENRPDPGGGEGLHDWRGVIVHIQTNQIRGFTDFAEAVAFISHHVRLGDFNFTPEEER